MRVKYLALLVIAILLAMVSSGVSAEQVDPQLYFPVQASMLCPMSEKVITQDDNGKQIEVKQGETFKVRLNQAVVPYKPVISVTEGLEVTGEQFYPHENDGTVGSAGVQEWEVKAVKAGKQKVIVTEEPLNSGMKSEVVIDVIIIVEPSSIPSGTSWDIPSYVIDPLDTPVASDDLRIFNELAAMNKAGNTLLPAIAGQTTLPGRFGFFDVDSIPGLN